MGGNLTIFDKDHDTTGSRRFLQPSIRLRYNYYVQLVATRRDWMRVPNLKFWSSRLYCRSKVLAAKHAASLQLLCTVGGS